MLDPARVGLPDLGQAITFKGGTSLSKAWGLIERFSEDIDLTVHKEALGFGGDASPENAPSKSKRKNRLKDLTSASQDWVQNRLRPALDHAIADRLGSRDGWTLEVDPDMDDGQTLLFTYPGAFPTTEAGYVRTVVKIEFGARSDVVPSEARDISPYVAQVFPTAIPDASVRVSCLAPERTFWEKAMLLHEETFRPDDKPRKERMARHYYDLWCLIARGVAERAAADRALFDRAAAHRQLFFSQNWVDYKTLRPGSLRLVPSPGHEDAWRRDYNEMTESMFYGDRPTFEEILRVAGEFEKSFNASR